MKAIIDFATWYSGMERAKVEKAYQRYLRETKVDNKSSSLDFCECDPPGKSKFLDFCFECGKRFKDE